MDPTDETALDALPLDMAFPGSSAVTRARYRRRERILDLWWKRDPRDSTGLPYAYLGVPEDRYRALLAVHRSGGSVGEFANREIKPFYRFRAPRRAA